MSLSIILSIVALAAATAVALWALDANRRRVRLLQRASLPSGQPKVVPILTIGAPAGPAARAAARLEPLLPESLHSAASVRQLARAGFETPLAVIVYALLRVVSAAAATAGALLWAPRDTPLQYALVLGAAILGGLALPPLVLSRLVRHRQNRIRHAVPDALDLLLVCVEAGVSLDTALLRVGREMTRLHPELAAELLEVNRTTNAGLRRDEALHNMYERTGVRELRALSGTLIQSEKWGTSVGTVLRVYAETMRLKRRQAAEKRAAVVATKMIFPLALLILPALFIIVAGPVILGMAPLFETFTQR